MKDKRIPLRKCLGCNMQKSKRELIRVVRNKEGQISIDNTGKKPGRGAYICNNVECLKQAIKTNRFNKAFECKIESEIFDKLLEEIGDINE